MSKQKTKPARVWGEWIEDADGNRVKDFPIHAGQGKVLESTTRITAVIAGTGGGKTATIPLWLMREIQRNPTGRFLVVAPSYQMMRRSTLREIQETFAGLPDFDGPFNAQRWEIALPTGGIIYFASADTPDSLQGCHANACVLDECGLMKSDTFRIARQRTNKMGGPILLTSTPYGFNWLYFDVYKPWKEGDKTILCVNFKATDNPTYNAAEFETERKRMPDWKFRQMYYGEFTRPAGVVFPGLRDCLIGPDKLVEVLDGQKPEMYVGGVDFGFNDPAAALVGFVHNNVLYIVWEKYQSGKTTREFARDWPPNVVWYCDSSRPDSIRELKRMGINARPCKKGPGSVSDGIDYLNGLINTDRLKIVRGPVKALLAEGDLYCYTQGERENTYTDRAEDRNNHALDALRYLAQGAKRRRLLYDERVSTDLAA